MSLFEPLYKLWAKLFGNQNQNESSSTTGNQTSITINTGGTMKKLALCVGINDYQGSQNDLSGCINDFNDWIDILSKKYGFTKMIKLVNSQATKESIKNSLSSIINEAVPGDVVVFTYSGHGSYVTDGSGDESDGKDETLYTYNGNLLDDELRNILNKAKDGVKIIVILDSCHSGTATRFIGLNAPKPRFMPPIDIEIAKLDAKLPTKKTMLSDKDMKEILLTGAKATEYSYDATFNGRPNGALTRIAIDALKKLGNPTYKEWHNEIRKSLPSNEYPQTPQLEGSEDRINGKVFE
jgi:hypothetical protein